MDGRYTQESTVEIWPDQLDAYEVFDACSSQWRIVTGAVGVFYQGIDASALSATMEMLGIDNRRQCLQHVRMIEAGALEVINRK